METTKTISDDAMSRLITYDWPGNVGNWRMLSNARWLWVRADGGKADLPSNLHYADQRPGAGRNEILPLEELERRAILKTLRETAGDKLAAARMLGIGKTTLYRKLKQYNMKHAED